MPWFRLSPPLSDELLLPELGVEPAVSAAVKLSSGLPDGEPNGLASIVQALINDPAELTCVVMLIDTKKLETDMDTGEVVPTGRIRRIEPITDRTDRREVTRLLARANERRMGNTVLPLDLEHQMRALGIDTDTGEVSE
jgi:hypothetical protein